MAKYKFVNEDENENNLTFKDLEHGDIFYVVDKTYLNKFERAFTNSRTPNNLRMKISGYNNKCMIDLLTGIQCEISDVNCKVKKYTGTLIFDEKDWTDRK